MSKSLRCASRWVVLGGAALVGLAWAGLGEAQTTAGGSSVGGTSSARGGLSSQGGGQSGLGGGQTGLGQNSAMSAPQGTFGIGTTQSRSAFRLGTTSRGTTGAGNQFSQFYANPMSYGVTGSTGTTSFGSPLYGNTTSGSTGGLNSGFGVSPTGGTSTGGGTRTGGFGGTSSGTTGSTGRTGTAVGVGTSPIGGGSSTFGGQGTQGGGRTGGTGFGGTGTGLTGGAGGFGGQSAIGVGSGTGRGATGMTGGLNTGLGGTSMLGGRGTAAGTRSTNAARSVPYVAELAEPLRPTPTPVAAGNFRTQVQSVITRSSAFAANRDIQVNTEGQVVVLQGAVGTDRERQLAEALLRLTPGVRDVRNELQVREPPPAPMPIPD